MAHARVGIFDTSLTTETRRTKMMRRNGRSRGAQKSRGNKRTAAPENSPAPLYFENFLNDVVGNHARASRNKKFIRGGRHVFLYARVV